ncbi:carboxylesterase/lipase family protein [Emcibacter sp.]|uniref:carboxylesterase/lipase family protein n=1 Tax=Emcibacter sp. TaxID=1979954 RepID=UPI003A8F2B84
MTKISSRFFAAFIGVSALMCGIAFTSGGLASEKAPVVNPPAGQLQGVREDDAVVFRAIPYAAPPVGDRRWRPPAPMPRWDGIRAAEQKGVACMQPLMAEGTYDRGRIKMSEDCLTLDVTASANARKAPVMVWIHGGTLIWGTAHSKMYDSREFAKRGIVLVSINYRLGVLGYLAHPELSRESEENISGNYGLMDQMAALRWVRENIEAFGGDASNVTIFGESAGALSVEYLLASPRARGLFDKAIVQSGYLFTMPELREARYEEKSAEAIGVELAEKLGVSGISELRAMEALSLVDRTAKAGYAPYGTIDGKILKRQLVDTFDRGEQAPVPLMAGFTSGEVRSLRFLLPPLPETTEAYASDISARYGDLAETYLGLYPPQDLEEIQLDAARDVVFGWASERLVRKQAALGQPSYLYLFSHSYPAANEANLEAFHASEVPFVFGSLKGTPEGWPAIPDTEAERNISGAMLDYWTSFARDGQPTSGRGPDWTKFASGRAYMEFGEVPTLSRDLFPGMYELHEQVMCRRRLSGKQSWNWRTGSIAPVLPKPAQQCSVRP